MTGSMGAKSILLELCVSSLRRGHANLLCIVPSLVDASRAGPTVKRRFSLLLCASAGQGRLVASVPRRSSHAQLARDVPGHRIMENPVDNSTADAVGASASTSLPAVLVALLLLVVTTAAGLSALTKRRALARLRKRAGCAPLRILPSGRLHLLLIKSRKQANLLTCFS